jgi:hypothetical protein
VDTQKKREAQAAHVWALNQAKAAVLAPPPKAALRARPPNSTNLATKVCWVQAGPPPYSAEEEVGAFMAAVLAATG